MYLESVSPLFLKHVFMPPRNLNVMMLAVVLSVLCFITNRRTRTALMVGSALDLIRQHYVDPVDDDALLTSAMEGLTGILDENSSYIRAAPTGPFRTASIKSLPESESSSNNRNRASPFV